MKLNEFDIYSCIYCGSDIPYQSKIDICEVCYKPNIHNLIKIRKGVVSLDGYEVAEVLGDSKAKTLRVFNGVEYKFHYQCRYKRRKELVVIISTLAKICSGCELVYIGGCPRCSQQS